MLLVHALHSFWGQCSLKKQKFFLRNILLHNVHVYIGLLMEMSTVPIIDVCDSFGWDIQSVADTITFKL